MHATYPVTSAATAAAAVFIPLLGALTREMAGLVTVEAHLNIIRIPCGILELNIDSV